jgi:protein phosphatase
MKYALTYNTIYELGQRSGQEDCIYPSVGVPNPANGLFIVCDGMGGHDRGEVASQAVCKAMSEYVIAHAPADGSFSEEDFKDALAAAYDALDALDDGAVKKMGTTMTFLKFHKSGCIMAHIGDSRIYHIRPSEPEGKRIIHVTRDHSLVNDLVAIGELTPEQAKTFKQKNIITRAMQPLQERRSRADVLNITDVRPGDVFYMCTDGMLECADDDQIEALLSDRKSTDADKIAALVEQTKNNKDNHSAVLVRVEENMTFINKLKKNLKIC